MATIFNIATATEKLKSYTPEQLKKMQDTVIASGNKKAIDQFASALAQSKTGVKTPTNTFQSTTPDINKGGTNQEDSKNMTI